MNTTGVKKKSFWKQLKKQRAGYLFILPQFLLFMGLMVYPMINGFRLSLYKITLKKNVFVGLGNYQKLLQDEYFIRAIGNTVLFVVCIVALAVVVGIGVSALIFDKNPKFVSFIRACYYIPVAVSMTVMAVTWSFLFGAANGLINYLISLVGMEPVTWLGNAKLVMPIIIFVTFVSNVGQVIVLYVAAMVGIPLGALFILRFVAVWNDYLWQMLMAKSSDMKTMMVGIASLMEENKPDMGRKLTGAAVSAFPMIVAFLSFQKYFTRGISVGAVKG